MTAPDLPVFPPRRTCPFAPPPEYARLREDGPATRVTLPTGQPAWLITGHRAARRILADPRVSADRSRPGYPRVFPLQRVAAREPVRSLVSLDPPEHTTHRRMLTGEFTVRRIRALRPRIQEIVDEHITRMLAGPRPADLVAALSLPVPSLVICDLLGVPPADREDFQAWTRVMVGGTSTEAQIADAMHALSGYIGELVTARETEPGPGLLSRLITDYRAAGTYDRRRVVNTGMLLLSAGHETTANMISLSTIALLDDPARRATLTADPTVVPSAVEELLRYFSIADAITARTATEDIPLGDVVIRAGDGLIVLTAAADHDPHVFPDPGHLDPHRNARGHLAFGYGVHQCLGQNLARAELEIVFATLFARIPTLRLATGARHLPYLDHAFVYGVREVPVTW